METTWQGVFRGLDGGNGAAPAGEAEPERRRGWFRRLRQNLQRSSRAMAQQLTEIAFDPADSGVWERLEEALIMADVGVPATVSIVQQLEAEAAAGRLSTSDELRDQLVEIVTRMMAREPDEASIDVTHRPTVLLVVGVNGTGKTTSIGKLAFRLHEAGASVVVGAADTFRAAAHEQLEVWAQRSDAQFVGSTHGRRPRGGGLRRGLRGRGPRPRRRPDRHRRPAAHPGPPDGGAREGRAGSSRTSCPARRTRRCW